MNVETTVDNNFELFEAQRIEELKVTTAILVDEITQVPNRTSRCQYP